MLYTLISVIIHTFFFLFPLFYLPITSESYEYNKMALLVTTCLVLIFLFSLKVIKEKRLTVVGSSFGTPLFLLVTIVVISTLFQSPNLAVALTTPLSTAAILAGFLLYFLLVNILYEQSDRYKVVKRETTHLNIKAGDASPAELGERQDPLNLHQLTNILILDGVLLSLYVISLYLGFFPQNQFTPAGTLLATAMFLAIISVFLVSRLAKAFAHQGKISGLQQAGDAREGFPNGASLALSPVERGDFEAEFGTPERQDPLTHVFPYLFSLLLISTTTILLTYHLLTNQSPLILSFSFGWKIFLEILKNFNTLLLGVGPANFLTAFSLAKPISFNLSNVWNVIFTSSSSFFLTLATETGIIAAALYLFLLLKSLKLLKLLNPYAPPLIFALALQLILPGNMSVFILTIILLVLTSKKKVLAEINFSPLGKIAYLLLVPLLVLFTVVFYFCGRAYLAEIYYKKSLDALINNQGKETYDFQNQAIRLNPYLDRYHLAFSKTSLALANAIAAKEDLSQEDTQNIPRLVQQAIDHARSAVVLYRTNPVNWDNLAKTYASLVNFAPGAQDWAITSYQQKILLDPANPSNHLALGGMYLNSKKYSQAESLFRQAVGLKHNFANAHYNLSIAFREQKKYQEAYRELQTTLALLQADSNDALKVEQEIAELTKFITLPQITPSPLPQESSQSQILEEVESSPSALINLPEPSLTWPTPLSTISFPPPPITP